MLNKKELVDTLVERMREEIKTLKVAAQAAREAATHEESKAEDQYDTRGLEASYLAGAQAQRVADLESQCAYFQFLVLREFKSSDLIDSGALVQLEYEGKKHWYFLVAQAGGQSVKLDGTSVQILTPHAPLGEALMGKRVGDLVEVEINDDVREYTVCALG